MSLNFGGISIIALPIVPATGVMQLIGQAQPLQFAGLGDEGGDADAAGDQQVLSGRQVQSTSSWVEFCHSPDPIFTTTGLRSSLPRLGRWKADL
ncbi:hypothetical protein [Paracoccus mutanolyticus]|uniref:hypothetical protein n=1 Tax=Paracoccus mutanolyticus TaxID=1499308 RepID=UPI001674E4B7|nr:hypothetical protein [Paracoccus mutanolyticus]